MAPCGLPDDYLKATYTSALNLVQGTIEFTQKVYKRDSEYIQTCIEMLAARDAKITDLEDRLKRSEDLNKGLQHCISSMLPHIPAPNNPSGGWELK